MKKNKEKNHSYAPYLAIVVIVLIVGIVILVTNKGSSTAVENGGEKALAGEAYSSTVGSFSSYISVSSTPSGASVSVYKCENYSLLKVWTPYGILQV